MEAQYYVPKIDEFHVGFEYEEYNDWIEQNDNQPTWERKTIFTHNANLTALDVSLQKNEIRVKHLDRQDIEECGWTQRDHDTYDIEGYALEFDSEYKTFIYHTGPRHGTVFKGTIRNKSELVKLMQMLNIK